MVARASTPLFLLLPPTRYAGCDELKLLGNRDRVHASVHHTQRTTAQCSLGDKRPFPSFVSLPIDVVWIAPHAKNKK